MARYPSRPLSEEAEQIKKVFLVNIGRVIKRFRAKKNLSQTELGDIVGLSHSQVGIYEDGFGDMKASLMARFSVALGFPMKEYVVEYNEHCDPGFEETPIDRKFKELIEYTKAKKAMPSKRPVDEDLPPKPKLKFDKEQYKWVIDEKSTIEKPISAPTGMDYRVTFNVRKQEDCFFNDYIENVDISGKKDLINYVYRLKDEPEVAGLTEGSMKTFIRAVLKFVISDADKNLQNRLRSYLRIVQSNLDETDSQSLPLD